MNDRIVHTDDGAYFDTEAGYYIKIELVDQIETVLRDLCHVKTWEGIRGNPKMQADGIFKSYAKKIVNLLGLKGESK